MNRAPQFLGLGAIDHVTYYQWVNLQGCPLKGAIPVFKLDGTLPEQVPTRAVLIGRFHHRAMELAVNASSVTELIHQIDSEIVQLQATVNEWTHLKKSGSVSGWDEVNRSASLARRIASNRGGRNSARVQHVERELKSRDGRLIGRPDFFSIGASDAVLREYKSGPIREPGGQLVPTYVDQLLFYSYLIFENFDVDRVVCHLAALAGDTHEVTIERQQADDFAADVVRLVHRINADLLAITVQWTSRIHPRIPVPVVQLGLSARNLDRSRITSG
jgi:hypothetical protein